MSTNPFHTCFITQSIANAKWIGDYPHPCLTPVTLLNHSPRPRSDHIDHVCISWPWASSLRAVSVSREDDVGSEHYLLVTTLQLKLKKIIKTDKKCYSNKGVQEQRDIDQIPDYI
uniref:Uncharacterized protein n=1 Tax=Chelonoidis abingdonii TaxID=106734 RepID=A0A8C0GDH3_CHEAB